MMNSNPKIARFYPERGGGSDLTLKQDVRNLAGGLSTILALRPVSWKWKNPQAGKDIQYGFIAQEVKKVLPDVVSDGTWIDGTTRKFLTMSEMVPYLVGAIQEQHAQIEALKQKIGE